MVFESYLLVPMFALTGDEKHILGAGEMAQW